MISVRNLFFQHDSHIIFDDVTFNINTGQKVGLIGQNGAGKSTLIKILCDQEKIVRGSVEIIGTLGVVPQEVKHDPVMEAASSIREYLNPDGMILDHELSRMLRGVELYDLSLEQAPHALSGGQKTRLALSRALLAEPDILLLDEPTNFLDTEGKKWVMGFLANYPKTLILISHDLELLDRSIDKILFVNAQTKKIEEYRGSYTDALYLKEEKEELLKKQVHQEQKNIARLEESIRVVGVKQRINLQNRVAKMKEHLPELPAEIRAIKFKLREPATVGALPLKAINISKSYGDKQVLKDINIVIHRGERVALIGPNGVGKSTFIKILMGMIEQDSGEIMRDSQVKIGYYSQEFENMDFSKTLIETARGRDNLPDSIVRPILARFLFPAQKINQEVGTLSGGEKTRLSIALMMLQDYNLLILDEPTTYLDIMSQQIILQVLKDYQGAILIVSHTEEFIKELQPNRALLLPENFFDYWSEDFLKRVADM